MGLFLCLAWVIKGGNEMKGAEWLSGVIEHG